RDGRTTGVALANGDEISAPVVVSGLDPRRTFIDLVEAKELPDDRVTSIANYRFRGSPGKVNLALDALPDFSFLRDNGGYRSPLLANALRGAVSISPSVDYLERAYDD